MKIIVFNGNLIPIQARPPSLAGCSLAPWRKWLEEGEIVTEEHSRYPVDKRRAG